MKCDELKVYVQQDGPYGLEPEEGGKLEEEETCYLKSDVDAAIAELKAENERLKKCEIWMKQHFYCEEVIACESAKNRRLKRALWLARANRAEARKNYWYVRSIHEGDNRLWSIDGSAVKYIGCIKRTNFDWLKIWSEVESKCRAKAEEYDNGLR